MASSSSYNCFLMAFMVVLACSSLGVGRAARHLLQSPTSPAVPLPPLPPIPTLQPSIPSIPNLPQPSLPTLPPFPSFPSINIPNGAGLPPLPTTLPTIPSIPTPFPSIPFLAPPPATSSP